MKKSLLVLLFSSAIFAASYTVDPDHSQVGFKIKHMMISNVTGYFKKFDGTFSIEKGKVTAIDGTIDVTSIDTDSAKRDGHLQAEDFFFTSKFPKMSFKMLSAKGNKVIGELTMRGITQKITLASEIGGEITDPWGNKRAGLELTGTLDRTAFAVSYKAGSSLLANSVKISVELEGIAK